MSETIHEQFRGTLARLGDRIHEVNRLNGWSVTTPERWANTNEVPAVLALIHSEVSEALEAFRHDDRENFAEELADVLMRVVGLSHGLEIDLAAAALAKIEKNATRGYHHGGKRI